MPHLAGLRFERCLEQQDFNHIAQNKTIWRNLPWTVQKIPAYTLPYCIHLIWVILPNVCTKSKANNESFIFKVSTYNILKSRPAALTIYKSVGRWTSFPIRKNLRFVGKSPVREDQFVIAGILVRTKMTMKTQSNAINEMNPASATSARPILSPLDKHTKSTSEFTLATLNSAGVHVFPSLSLDTTAKFPLLAQMIWDRLKVSTDKSLDSDSLSREF